MKRTFLRTTSALAATAFCLSGATAFVRAQAVSASQAVADKAAAEADPRDKPMIVAQTDSSTGEEILVLSPFNVDATQDKGYLTMNTLAATRLKTDLRDVGSAITAINAEFLRDTGARNSSDLLVYTTNTEVGGIGGNFLGAGNSAQINTSTQRAQPQQNTRVRGLTAADNTRNYFLTDIPWDSYNTGRIDLQRGPNAILFGLGSPAGIINNTLSPAEFKDKNTVEFRYGSYGTARGTLDINKVLLKDELAIRAIGLDSLTHFRQDPAYNRDERVYAAVRYDPKFLRIKGARTTLQGNYENGRIRANNPDPTPPIDAITPWFNTQALTFTNPDGSITVIPALNKASYDASVSWASDPAFVNDPANAFRRPGVLRTSLDGNAPSTYFTPYVRNMGRLYDNVTFVYGNPRSGAPGVNTTSASVPYFEAITASNKPFQADGGAIDGLVAASLVGITSYDIFAQYANLPGQQLGQYKAKSLTDASIFDFYNNLLGGPNDKQDQKWEAFNLSLQQTFLDNRLGIEAGYDSQRWSQTQEFIFQGFANAITIDINTFLPDGTPNPNFGRPAVASDSGYNASTDTDRTAYRITAFGELRFSDFMDKNNALTSILGRHIFTLMFSHEENETTKLQWSRYTTDDVYGQMIKSTSGPNRQIATINYLGDSLASRPSASGIGLTGIKAAQQPNDTKYLRRLNSAAGTLDGVFWETVPATIWNADLGQINNLYSNGSKSKSEDDACAFVWQGFFLDGTVIPTVGYRKDSADYYDAGPIPAKNDGVSNPRDPAWRLHPADAFDGHSTSWSLVARLPQTIKKKLPWGTDISIYYNESENFSPVPGRVGVVGEALPVPEGKTRDYGITLSTLDDRVVLKINWYKSSVKNATLSGGVPGGFYMIGDSEAWGYLFAKRAQNHFADFADDYLPGPGQTQADATAEQALAVSTFLGSLQSDDFWKAWNIRGDGKQLTPATADAAEAWKDWIEGPSSSALAITGDTESKGTEFELTAQPTKNWTITINASKTHATQTSLANSVEQWIEERHAFFEGPAGLVRLWNNTYSPGETLRGKFGRETYSQYLFLKQQAGSDVPELRPWRFNIVTNYTFDHGAIKGFNIGGGYRWQDRQIVGYAMTPDFEALDISRPYHSPTLNNFDFWIGYQRKLTKKIDWRIQLNIQNAFAKKELIPVTVEPDGSWAQVRIPELTQWTLTNTFKF